MIWGWWYGICTHENKEERKESGPDKEHETRAKSFCHRTKISKNSHSVVVVVVVVFDTQTRRVCTLPTEHISSSFVKSKRRRSLHKKGRRQLNLLKWPSIWERRRNPPDLGTTQLLSTRSASRNIYVVLIHAMKEWKRSRNLRGFLMKREEAKLRRGGSISLAFYYNERPTLKSSIIIGHKHHHCLKGFSIIKKGGNFKSGSLHSWSAHRLLFCFILLTHEGSHREVNRDF